MGETHGRTRADEQSVEITHSRFALRGDPASVAWPGRGDQLGFEAKLRFQDRLHFSPELIGGRNRENHLSLFSFRFPNLFPPPPAAHFPPPGPLPLLIHHPHLT